MYKAYMGWGGCHNYSETIYLLYINADNNGSFDNWKLQSENTVVTGNTIDSLLQAINSLDKTTLVYVDDLNKIRAYLYNYITKDRDISIEIFNGKIEFRSWTMFTKDNVYNVMMDWEAQFNRDKYPYLTPSQYSRKQIAKTQAGKAAYLMPKHLFDLSIINKSVHPGVLYCRDTNITENMLGFDISSAYIYSLVFCKHASSTPKIDTLCDWEYYLNCEDTGFIGCFDITYNCIFSIIHCYKDVNGKPLQNGKHTVKVVLTNIDLQVLLSIPQFNIDAIKCDLLYTFKLDYLPIEIRQYCIDQYLLKQKLPKDSTARKRQKVVINSVYGNLLYDMGKILTSDNPHSELKIRTKNASTSPIWGAFTMAYTKKAVISLGINMAMYKYSDTDSIYCGNDTHNIKIITNYNDTIRNNNHDILNSISAKYNDKDIDLIVNLGTFEIDANIKRFRAWGYKTYAYETTDGKVIVKAAGCNKQYVTTDPNVVFSQNYKPPKGKQRFVRFTKDKYIVTTDYSKLILPGI